MGRPTDEPKNRLVGIRLDKELEDFFVTGKENISEGMRMALKEYVKQKNLEKHGFVEQNIDSVKQNSAYSVKHYEELQSKFNELSERVIPGANDYFKNGQYGMLKIVPAGFKSDSKKVGEISADLYKHIMSMVSTYGMTYEEFMRIIDFFLEKCFISNDGKETYTVDSRLDTSSFMTKCEEYGIKDYQGVFDKMVKTMKVN